MSALGNNVEIAASSFRMRSSAYVRFLGTTLSTSSHKSSNGLAFMSVTKEKKTYWRVKGVRTTLGLYTHSLFNCLHSEHVGRSFEHYPEPARRISINIHQNIIQSLGKLNTLFPGYLKRTSLYMNGHTSSISEACTHYTVFPKEKKA